MKGYMYILKCSDNSYYVGSTNNIQLRLDEHNNGLGAEYTKKRRPVQLVYVETFSDINKAYKREKQIQGWSRKKREALISKRYENLPDLSVCKNKNLQSPSAAVAAAVG